MKLEDEIRTVVHKNTFAQTTTPLISDIADLIERYCKRQRELCADELVYAYGEDYTIYGAIKENMIYKTKLATEE